MHTAVQLTFSFEIASLQLTPSFKMRAVQLKPTSKIVTMRPAPSQQSQPTMNLQVTFEIANVQASGGAIGQIRLTPSQEQRPGVTTTPAFGIAGLQLISTAETGAVQLTPAQQGGASVHVTGQFQLATVEFSPSFEIAALVLNATSKSVSVQLPGAGPSAVEGAPVFEIASIQTGSGGIELLQLVAPRARAAVPTVRQPATIRPPRTIEAQPATHVRLPIVVTTMEKRVEDLSSFLAVLATAGVSSARPLQPQLEVCITVPHVSSIDEFVERAINGDLVVPLDVTSWAHSTKNEIEQCIFMAQYRSGVVRPVTVDVAYKDGTVLLTLTDPICFFDPNSPVEDFRAGPIADSFDLAAFQLPLDA
ncbi:MAG: hypothetical protein QOG51_242 [Verrucomicrobiota bacterium]|jgi:hypothetical protein